MATPALLIDRDGTLVLPRHYPRRPMELQLYPGLGRGLRRLQDQGWPLVVITNQSGVARGYLSELDLDVMHAYLGSALADLDVRLAAVYACPHHPEGVVARYSVDCSCRKPQPGLLLRAAAELDLDLEHSWFIGDILDDVEAGNSAGCRTVLVDLGTEGPPTSAARRPTAVARCTRHALDIVAALSDLGVTTDLSYRPVSWLTAREAGR
jgi:D-glycero-D-manno-heptose 1,7-bisphosphate phosphatase